VRGGNSAISLIRHHAAGDQGRRERCPAALVIMI